VIGNVKIGLLDITGQNTPYLAGVATGVVETGKLTRALKWTTHFHICIFNL